MKMRCSLLPVLLSALVFITCSTDEVESFRRQVSIPAVSATTAKRRPSSTQKHENTASLSISQRLLAGGASRSLAQMVLYPIDALRTLAQTRDGRTLSDVGAGALVRGCATTSSFALFIGSAQFAIFGATREIVGPVVASALGAAGSCLISVPQEVIKQRLVTGIYASFRHACQTIYKEEGILGFYSAWRPTMARNVPFVIVTFSTMDWLKERRMKKRGSVDMESKELSVADNLAIGVSSALVAAVLTQPADVIKTRMMTQAASSAVPYSSTMDCVKTILKAEGVMPFYSGFIQRTLYMGPLWAIQFALNGYVSKELEKHNKDKAETVYMTG